MTTDLYFDVLAAEDAREAVIRKRNIAFLEWLYADRTPVTIDVLATGGGRLFETAHDAAYMLLPARDRYSSTVGDKYNEFGFEILAVFGPNWSTKFVNLPKLSDAEFDDEELAA